jgi:hypothetical protein
MRIKEKAMAYTTNCRSCMERRKEEMKGGSEEYQRSAYVDE